jgi:VCBS repeat-containing protein
LLSGDEWMEVAPPEPAAAQPSGIIWRPSPNYNNRPAGQTIDAVVIHTTEGSYSGAISWMQNPNSQVSAHYCISPSGEISQLVQLSDRAWHATYYNSRSIGIEMAGFAGDPNTWNATNLGRLEDLVAWLVTQYDIPIVHPGGTAYDYPNDSYNAAGLVAHAQVQPWNRSDPGAHFPWENFVASVRLKANEAPAAADNAYTIAEDTPLAVAAGGVLSNDSDAEGNPLSATLIATPANGTLSLAADGSFTYTPRLNFAGVDSFTYQASDGLETSNVARATITVSAVDDAPQIVGETLAVDADATLVVSGTAGSVTLVPAGAVWKFLDNGSNQGTAWRGPDFSDAAWPSGPAQLGYGEGDETTVVGFGGNPAAKHATTYFRHAFQVAGSARFSSLSLRLKRDDGAAVYLNGVEIVRDSLAGNAAFDTLAANAADDGQSFATLLLPATLLASGRNVLAVEVHQASAASTDLSFDLELIGTRQPGLLANDFEPEGQAMSAVVVRGPRHGEITLAADGTLSYTPQPGFRGGDSFTYRAADGALSSAPVTVTVRVGAMDGPASATADVYQVDQGGTLVAADVASVPLTLVPDGSIWRYLDDGSDLGTAWRQASFDDGGWKRGPAQLGYGDGDEATPLGYGPDAATKFVTTYFRHAFELHDAASIDQLSLELVRDDGAAVFLNGVEVARSDNLAPAAAFDALANFSGAGSVGGDDENRWWQYAVDPQVLVEGTNVLAVEVHQHSRGSSDLSFDLALSAQRARRGVLMNDLAAGGGPLLAELVDGPAHGAVALAADGSFSYTPQAGFLGAERFSYRVRQPGAVLLARGSASRFLDDGSNPGPAWSEPGFDDTLWPSGAAQLGYGDGDEASPISFGPSAAAKYPAAYFRRTFAVSDVAGVESLQLRFQRDDGAAVYLNGVEIARNNLAAAADFDDFALANAAHDGRTWIAVAVDPALLVEGANVLAAEVHQASAGSSDLSFDLELSATRVTGPATVSIDVLGSGAVVGRHVFYNNSAYDGNNASANASDDAAIAPDKSALLPGQTASLANYTSYSKGINGLMIDLVRPAGAPLLTAGDFAFHVGNDNHPAGWAAAPAPANITVRSGAGAGGSDRVTLIWADGAIKRQWLRVAVLAGANTGLAADDVFYFGNAVGEVGNSTTNAIVSAADEALIRLNGRNALNPAPIDFRFDINRDRLVGSSDQALCRLNSTNALSALRLIAVPASSPLGPREESGAALAEVSSELLALQRRRRR